MWCDDTMRPFAGHHHGRRMSVLSDPTPQPADLSPAGAPVSARAPIWRLAQDIAFGRDADRTATQGAGWAPPLAAKCWTDGTQSELCLRHGGAADLVLEIDAAPFLGASALASQRLIVHVNGWPAGELLCRDGRRRALHLNGAASFLVRALGGDLRERGAAAGAARNPAPVAWPTGGSVTCPIPGP
jgi:hypothetical protein